MEQLSPQVYAAECLKEGVAPEAVKQNLISVGWSEEEARGAVVAGLIASGVPIPAQGRGNSGHWRLSSTIEVVLNFFSFITLGIVVTALGTLYYQVINNYFPDPLVIRYGGVDVSPETVHYALAALIITFPIYILSVRLWFKRFREDEAKVETRLTKWLTYLVLLVSAVTIVGDLITAVFYLLQGEVTPRFFLKALTILVVAGVVFGFYFLERKKIQYRKDISRRIFLLLGWAVLGLVAIAVALGFVVGGSPSLARKSGLDAQRASDLRTIAICVADFAINHKRLPDTFAELSQSTQYAYCQGSSFDPETGVAYEYRVSTPSRVSGGVREGEFELCANFTLEAANTKTAVRSPGYSSDQMPDKWMLHGVGRSCDTAKVILERFLDSPAPSSSPEAAPVNPIKKH